MLQMRACQEIPVPEDLKKLIELASKVPVSAEHRENQRRSFAFGNTHFENDKISREMVDRQAEKLAQEMTNGDVSR
jgi:hypothetical protein